MKIIILFSGGMDSYAAYCYAKNVHGNNKDNEIIPMYIDYQGEACKKEIYTAKSLLPETKVIKNVFNFSDEEKGELNFLYARNLYFAIYASQYADIIYLGGTKNSIMLDDTKEFYKKASVICSQVKGKDVLVMSPFSDLEKSEIIDWMFKSFGYSIGQQIANTSSCYHPEKQFCWSCWNCLYFLSAVWEYENDIPLTLLFKNKKLLKEAYEKAIRGEMLPKRTTAIIKIYDEFIKGE